MTKLFFKYLFAVIVIALASMWTIGELLLLSDAITKKSAAHRAAATATVRSIDSAIDADKKGDVKPAQFLPKAEAEIKTADALPSLSPEQKEAAPEVSVPAQSNLISVQFAIERATSTYNIPEGSTVLDLMREASLSKAITFMGRQYSGLGILIVSINGKESDQDHNDLYWIYSVNGKKATIGVSQYALKDGDIVSWSYESSTM